VGLRLATRGSALALAQAGRVAERLPGSELLEVASDGAAGDKSRFVRGVEGELLEGRAEVGIHSAKDLPAEMPDGLVIAAVAEREERADAWIGVGASLDDVPDGARVGTASLRRRAQLRAARPDLRIEELHGNVDTRLRKLETGDLDAIVLAAAGLRRLGRESEIAFLIGEAEMTPAAGQGSLALQIREADDEIRSEVEAIGDESAAIELQAERAVVIALDASCATPLGVSARHDGETLVMDAFVGLPDGSQWIRDSFTGDAGDPSGVGRELAGRMLAAGAEEILAEAEAA
jgi:hydroxymethylbilane synthase